MARKAVLVAIALTGIFLAIYLLPGEQSQTVKAQGCSGQLSMEPTDPYTLGTHVILRGTSNCGTVRFEIKGNGRTWHKAEIGTNNQIETWKTEETGSGTFEVCFVARGEGGWERAHRTCRTVYVEGGQAPPPGSQQGERVKCWVNAFNITPGTVQVGQTVNLAAQGQCDGNMRAARFTIDGSGWGEHTTNTHNTGWSTSGYSAGNHQICYQVTAGDWGQAASSCVSVTLTQAPSPTPYVEQGPPADNGIPGQTEDSNPSMVDHPQGDPPPAQVAPPAQVPPPAHNSSNNGNSGAGSGSSGGGNVNSSNDSGGSARCNANSRLQVGAIAVVSDATPDPLPLRSGPATSNVILVQIPVRQLITIIGGPVCSGKFVWWETQYGGRTGWAAEINGYGNLNLLPNGASLPSSSSGSSSSDSGNDSGSNSASASGQSGTLVPSNLTGGMRARVTYDPPDNNTLWDRPGPGRTRIRSMPPGTEFQIIGGPEIHTYRYWQVQLDDGTVGWTADGDNKNRWLEPAARPSGVTTEPVVRLSTFSLTEPVVESEIGQLDYVADVTWALLDTTTTVRTITIDYEFDWFPSTRGPCPGNLHVQVIGANNERTFSASTTYIGLAVRKRFDVVVFREFDSPAKIVISGATACAEKPICPPGYDHTGLAPLDCRQPLDFSYPEGFYFEHTYYLK